MSEITLLGDTVDEPRLLCIKVDNDYYIPPSVSERAYLPVLYGNHIHGGVGVGGGTRGSPEYLQPQPNTHLTYYLIIVGALVPNFIRYTNYKLKRLSISKLAK